MSGFEANDGAFTIIDNPLHPWPPSKEILKLRGSVTNFTKPELPTQLSSPYHPINFVTALLTHMAFETDPTKFEDVGVRLDGNNRPIQILTDVRVYTPQSYPDPEITVAESVILNRAFSGTSGLIVTGNYAGTVLEVGDGIPPEEGMVVRRLFRDDKVANFPDLPSPRAVKAISDHPELISLIEQEYKNFVNFASVAVNANLWLSELFRIMIHLSLGKEGIEVAENFYTSRDPDV